MKIVIFITDQKHDIISYFNTWRGMNPRYDVSVIHDVNKIPAQGDILFLVSCHKKIEKSIRDNFSFTLVLHASDLPLGRGWSPHIWSILNGETEITLSMINAEDNVDTGDIWKKELIKIDESDLYDDINHKLFNAEINLIDWACENIYQSSSSKQQGRSTYFEKRTPADSELDIQKTIEEQFDKIRVCDPDRYPAFFVIKGHKFKISIEHYDEIDDYE